MRAIVIAAVLVAGLAGPGPALAAGGCPTSRAYLEPRLKTRPEDGEYYAVQREAIRVPIARLLKRMGGPRRAHAIARAVRAHARRKLAEGAVGAARRNWQDTVLRAEALIEILTCMGQLGDPA
jgi:hypothetical protein